MLLTIDVGNTSIKLAIYNENRQMSFSILDTVLNDYKSNILSFIYHSNLRENQIHDCIISCVVPSVFPKIFSAIQNIIHRDPIVIENKNFYGIAIDQSITDEIGSDILVMSSYAYQKIHNELLVLSLGTATVISHISADGFYRHCIIAPGYETMAGAMYNNAAKLPEINNKVHPSFLANNTVDAMSIGVSNGFIGMVKYLLAGIQMELKTNPTIIGCGGAGKDIAPYIKEISFYKADLVTEGLNFIYNKFYRR